MNEVNASDIRSATLAVGEVTDCIGQFNSWIPSPTHDKNSFQQVSSIPPHHNLQNQAEKTKSINGCRVLHLINGESTNLETLAMFGEKDESSTCTSTGTESAVCVAGGEYQQHRPRSRSIGLVVTPDTFQETTSRSHSRDSLGSYGSLADEYQTTGKSESTEETLVEVTCNKFKRLSTRGSESPKSGSESPKSGIASPKSLSPVIQSEDVKSCFIRSRIYDKEIGRKYSFGSQLSSAKRQLSGRQEYAIGPLPIDLTCKRKKSDATSTSLNCLSMHGADGGAFNTVGHVVGQTNVGFENVGSFEDQSILKSVLVGMVRKRSHTLSVCSRQDFKNNSSQETAAAAATSSGFSLRQRMTLAKRNLGPVTRRTSEHLKRITQFLRLLPDFVKLSANDQRTLISDSVHRLLMLCMAESNQQFVVTPIREEEVASSEEGTAAYMEEPTMQFTETVQNYISKCQAMNINSREYSYMKIITLFHTGSRTLENVSLVEKANADAQQHLQSLVQHCYPDDRLRYSKLLLSLYTLFGINCNMLESLFCRHLISNGNGGLQKFILTEFMTNKYLDDSA